MSSLTLVIDQGTHATRALCVDENGVIRFSCSRDVRVKAKDAVRVEQDAEEIIASVHDVIQAALTSPVVQRMGICRAGLATQRSSVVAWDKRTGKPLAPMLSWQDRRAWEWLEQFREHAETIRQRTGLQLSPHYGASKLRWLLDNIPEVRQAREKGCLALGPLASFLIFHLLQKNPLYADHANASRTLLWNLHTREWDVQLMDLFGIPVRLLPQCCPISADYGILKAADIPLTAVNGDQTSAIYSPGQPPADTAIVNLGTGAFILVSTGSNLLRHPLLLNGLSNSSETGCAYMMEGSVNGSGAALSWAAEKWNLPNIIELLSEGLSREKDIPLFINTIGGMGSPWWQAGPSPALIGTGTENPRQIAAAVAESILFLLQVNLDIMQQTGADINHIRISGGLARSASLCQRMADLSGCVVYRPADIEATARGIAWLAAGRPRNWHEPAPGRHFMPQHNMEVTRRYERFCQELPQLRLS